MPFDVLAGSADIIIGIDVAGGPAGLPGERPGKVDALYASSQLMQGSIAQAMAKSHRVDLFLRPDVGAFRVLDFINTRSIIEHTSPFRDEVKQALEPLLN